METPPPPAREQLERDVSRLEGLLMMISKRRERKKKRRRRRDAIGRQKTQPRPRPFFCTPPLTPAEAAREAEQQQEVEEEEEQAPRTPGGAEDEEAEEEEEEDDEDDDDDDAVLESDDEGNADENTTEAEKLRRQANREADAKLAQKLLADLREEVASLETDEWEHEKPRFG